MASLGSAGASRKSFDGGMHFTWLLSTEREDDLDMVSDDDGDDAMVQLDEEYMSEMERKAALRDQERDLEEEADIDQLEAEDRMARAEYDDGRGLVSPRRHVPDDAGDEAEDEAPRQNPSTCRRVAQYIPCAGCCFPESGSHRKECTSERAMKKTKAFCTPNLELLRTLRVVKHVRLFRKILTGNAKISYGPAGSERQGASDSNLSQTDLGLSETESMDSPPSSPSSGLQSGANSLGSALGDNTVEMDEYEVNEITGERTRRRAKPDGPRIEPHVHLDLESGVPHSSRNVNFSSSDNISSLSKPTWPQRRHAAMDRAKLLAKETLQNVKPGIITAVVNFPLVLAVAGGVGAHPYYGLNAAFWAALAATFFGGSRYTIAAPTMLLTSNLVNTVSEYGTFVLPVIALLAALIIYLLVFTRAIEFMTFVPSMVTHGVTLGTSALVIIYQLKFALGLAGNIHASSVPYYVLEMCSAALKESNWWAILMFAVAQIITYCIIRWGRGFNIAYVLVPLGIIVGWLLDYTVNNQTLTKPYIETLGTRYGHVEFHPFLLTHWQAALFNWTVLGKSMEVAFICVMESYSTANLTYEVTGKRFSKAHEMFSLATANFISGVFGGMPTSVGVTRTLLNIRSGATSRAAGLVNGLALLLFAVTMTNWLRWFPLPVVATLQITAAWRSVDTAVWSRAWQEDRRSTFTSFITALLCVVVNPFIGLLIGIVISMSIFSRQLSKGHSELTVKTKVHRLQLERDRGSFLSLSPSTPLGKGSTYINRSFNQGLSRSPSDSNSPKTPGGGPAPRLARLRGDRASLVSSLADLPASRTLSIRNAVAQLQPILDIAPDQDASSSVKYNVVVYRISGVMTFINAQTHFETLKAITQHKGVTCLILNVRFLYYVDYDGKVVLRNLIQYVDSRLDLPTYLVGVTMDLSKQIKREQWYKLKKRNNLIWKLESDAFKDIQRRNAELIESGVATMSNSMATLPPGPNGEGMESNSVVDPSEAASSSGTAATPTSGTTAGSIPFYTIPLNTPPRTSISASRSDIQHSTSINRVRSNSISTTSTTLATPSTPPFNAQSASAPFHLGEDTLKNSSSGIQKSASKRNFAFRRSAIGSSSQLSASTLPPPGTVTTEEMELAITEAALSIGLDPAKAVASAEAFLRAHRMHRDAQNDDMDDPEAARQFQHELVGSPGPVISPDAQSSTQPPATGGRSMLLQSGVISSPITTREKPRRHVPRGGRKKFAVSPTNPSGADSTGEISASSVSAGDTTGGVTFSNTLSPHHARHRNHHHSDLPRGLARFQYGTAPEDSSHHLEGGGISSGAEFDAEDELSDGSSLANDSVSSSSDDSFRDRIVTGAYSDYMSPVEDDSPLQLNLNPILQGQSGLARRSVSSAHLRSSTTKPPTPQSSYSHSLSDLPRLSITTSRDEVSTPNEDKASGTLTSSSKTLPKE